MSAEKNREATRNLAAVPDLPVSEGASPAPSPRGSERATATHLPGNDAHASLARETERRESVSRAKRRICRRCRQDRPVFEFILSDDPVAKARGWATRHWCSRCLVAQRHVGPATARKKVEALARRMAPKPPPAPKPARTPAAPAPRVEWPLTDADLDALTPPQVPHGPPTRHAAHALRVRVLTAHLLDAAADDAFAAAVTQAAKTLNARERSRRRASDPPRTDRHAEERTA